MLKKTDYEKIKKQVLEFIPKKIIDAHVHTGTSAENVNEVKQELHPLSYGIMKNRTLTIPLDVFSRIFPNTKTDFVGFPLPLPFKEINETEWNNNLMISEMKKGINGLLLFRRNLEEMQKTLNIAEENNVKFHGVKIHPRLFPEKQKQTVLASDLIKKEHLEFFEKNKLTMLLELSHGLCEEDISFLKKVNNNYKINIVLPHMTYNRKGFLTYQYDYLKSLKGNSLEFEEEFSKIRNLNNVFMDSSMIIDKRIIETGINILGEDKIIYGTDYPFCFTSKIKENRPGDEVLIEMIKSVIDNNPVKDIWKYDYNIYLMVKAIIDAQNTLNLDVIKKIMRENAIKAFKLSL